ncbi:MAG: hypothetical protein MJ236_07160 [Clostridia bacterium]|nr:hypothetical protein [Clostridia bacterium]
MSKIKIIIPLIVMSLASGCSVVFTYTPSSSDVSSTLTPSNSDSSPNSGISTDTGNSSSSDISTQNPTSSDPTTIIDTGSSDTSTNTSSEIENPPVDPDIDYDLDIPFTEPEQGDSPNTLYDVYGTSSSTTTGNAPTRTYTTSRMTYVNRASEPSNYACVYNSNGNIIRYLKKGVYYTSLDDIASYILAFKELPANYLIGRNASKATAYNNYGQEYSRIAPGFYGLDYSGSSFDGKDNYPYSTLPKSTDGNYFELDIGYTWTDEEGNVINYAGSTSYNRGPLRLIVYFEGVRASGEDLNTSHYNDSNPVIFFTPDHYQTCYEYGNFYGAWSKPLFKNSYSNYTPLTTK